jgi:hypothetical protein
VSRCCQYLRNHQFHQLNHCHRFPLVRSRPVPHLSSPTNHYQKDPGYPRYYDSLPNHTLHRHRHYDVYVLPHFDLQAAVTGKNKGGRRRRNDDDDEEYDWEDYHNNEGSQGLFDNDLWDLTDEELAEIEREENDGNGSADETDDYVSIDNTGTQISECTRNFVFIFLSHSRR